MCYGWDWFIGPKFACCLLPLAVESKHISPTGAGPSLDVARVFCCRMLACTHAFCLESISWMVCPCTAQAQAPF
jgi:hypothetical protein